MTTEDAQDRLDREHGTKRFYARLDERLAECVEFLNASTDPETRIDLFVEIEALREKIRIEKRNAPIS